MDKDEIERDDDTHRRTRAHCNTTHEYWYSDTLVCGTREGIKWMVMTAVAATYLIDKFVTDENPIVRRSKKGTRHSNNQPNPILALF